MAKTARKAKARRKSKKKARAKPQARRAKKLQKKAAPRKKAAPKKPSAKARKVATAPAGNVPSAAIAESSLSTTLTLPLSLDSPRQTAVSGCVNGYMNERHKGWDADGNGNNKHLKAGESPQLLGLVQKCLSPKHYRFTITPELAKACAAGSISDIKYEIYKVTKAT